MHPFDLLDTGYLLLFQKSRQLSECEGMPFNGFGTVVLTLVVKNVLINAGAYETTTDFIDRITLLADPGKHLLHDASFVKDNIEAGFSASFLLVDIPIPIKAYPETSEVSSVKRPSSGASPGIVRLAESR